jgi:hypothetical protein
MIRTLHEFTLIMTMALSFDVSNLWRKVPDANFTWKRVEDYYFPLLDHKMQLILDEGCYNTYKETTMNTITIPISDSEIFASTFSTVVEELRPWWSKMRPASQLRVEPALCNSAKSKKKPIFYQNGCNLPHYMHPSAPRCQNSYLHWLCENAAMNITSTLRNGFIMPEANHSSAIVPPFPFLLTAKRSQDI